MFRSFQRGQRAVNGTEGRRRDIGLWRGERAVEGTEGRRGDRGPYKEYRAVEGLKLSTYSDNRCAIIAIIAKFLFFAK